jgi:methylmalonyl-CoA mutase
LGESSLKMLASTFKIGDDFPPVSYEQWRALAEADLNGRPFDQELVSHTYDGIDIQPLYTRRDQLGSGDVAAIRSIPTTGHGESSAGTRGRGWDLRQEHTHPDLKVANQAILEDVAGGVNSICVQLDSVACRGFDPDDRAADELVDSGGIKVYTVDDLDALLAGVDLALIGVSLKSGGAFLPAAAMLIGLWRHRGVGPKQARGTFNADPLGVLSAEGVLPITADAALAQLAELAAWTSLNYPLVIAVGVDTSVYHHAGATAAQDIGYGVATGVEYLRAMTAVGMEIDPAARQIEFDISLGTHHFLAIAKWRAARRVWARIVEASGGSPKDGVMRINARTSRRVLTRRDPYVNLLRNTAAVFAAGIGGADSITSVPFDAMLGMPDEFSRRVARNTVLILRDEAHLQRVLDPAGGSWFLDRLTEQIAEKAWEIFQDIERRGGMLKALESGWIHQQIDAANAARTKNIPSIREKHTSTRELDNAQSNVHPHPEIDRAVIRRAAIDRIAKQRFLHDRSNVSAIDSSSINSMITAAMNGASIGQLASALGFHQGRTEITPLTSSDLAELFDELGGRGEIWRDSQSEVGIVGY